jgi:hypothetical protein
VITAQVVVSVVAGLAGVGVVLIGACAWLLRLQGRKC